MWICVKCRQQVDDQIAVCPHCGAARSAGRFSRGVQPGQTPKAQYTPDPAPVHAGRGFIAYGSILALLLAALWIALACSQHTTWADSLYSLIGGAGARGKSPSFMVGYLLYGLLTAIGAMLAALPGLFTVALGKILRKLGKIEDRL